MLYTPLEREPEKPFYRVKTFWASCRLAGLFVALVMASYVLYPDWMWMYFVSTKALGLTQQIAIVSYVFLMLYVIPFVAGYFGGSTFRANKKVWRAGIILNLALEGMLIFALWNRYSAVGTREEFLQGSTMLSLSDFHLLGVLLNGGGIVLVILGVWQWRRLRRPA